MFEEKLILNRHCFSEDSEAVPHLVNDTVGVPDAQLLFSVFCEATALRNSRRSTDSQSGQGGERRFIERSPEAEGERQMRAGCCPVTHEFNIRERGLSREA